MFKRNLFLLYLALTTLSLYSQKTELIISGTVIDSITKVPIESASVLILNVDSNQIISGITTNSKGFFKINAFDQNILLEIRSIGYENKIFKEFKGEVVDLGSIYLKEQINMLNEVEVRAEKSTTEFRLDKRVFNVGKDLSSTGASAYEVLENVPSVTVTIEGEVSLRGNSGVQILINGKPSVLADQSGNALGLSLIHI